MTLRPQKRKQGSRSSILFARSFSIVLIVTITFIVYLNSIHNDFVFDDAQNIVTNHWIVSLKNIPKILGITTGKPLYRPIRHVSYALDYALWGLNPLGYHLSNLLYHSLAAVLVFMIVSALVGNRRIALWTAIIFAVHPVQTDSVTYLSGRRDVLCGLFYFLGFYSFVRYRQTGLRRYVPLFLGAYVLSIFSKEMGVTLPVMFILYDLFALLPQQSSFGQAISAGKEIIAKHKLLYAALTVGAGTFVAYKVVLRNPSHAAGYYGGNILYNFLTVARVHVHYIKQLFFPLVLNADYSYNAFPATTSALDPEALFAVVFLTFVAFALIRLLRTHKYLTFCGLWFFISLLPVSQIFPHHELLAEHYLYIPLFGFGFFVTLLLHQVATQWIPLRTLTVIFIILTTLLGTRTWIRNRDWKDDFTLWGKTVSTAPNCARAHNNYGQSLVDKGAVREGIQEYRRAIEIKPDYAEAYCNLGVAYDLIGLPDLAGAQFRKAIKVNPRFAEAYYNLGVYLAKKGQLKDAAESFENALRLKHRMVSAHFNLGLAYDKLDRKKKALYHFRRVIKLDPDSALAKQCRKFISRLEGS